MVQMNKTAEKLLIRFINSLLLRFSLQTEGPAELVCQFMVCQQNLIPPIKLKTFFEVKNQFKMYNLNCEIIKVTTQHKYVTDMFYSDIMCRTQNRMEIMFTMCENRSLEFISTKFCKNQTKIILS